MARSVSNLTNGAHDFISFFYFLAREMKRISNSLLSVVGDMFFNRSSNGMLFNSFCVWLAGAFNVMCLCVFDESGWFSLNLLPARFVLSFPFTVVVFSWTRQYRFASVLCGASKTGIIFWLIALISFIARDHNWGWGASFVCRKGFSIVFKLYTQASGKTFNKSLSLGIQQFCVRVWVGGYFAVTSKKWNQFCSDSARAHSLPPQKSLPSTHDRALDSIVPRQRFVIRPQTSSSPPPPHMRARCFMHKYIALSIERERYMRAGCVWKIAHCHLWACVCVSARPFQSFPFRLSLELFALKTWCCWSCGNSCYRSSYSSFIHSLLEAWIYYVIFAYHAPSHSVIEVSDRQRERERSCDWLLLLLVVVSQVARSLACGVKGLHL